jgi:SAM-dependent methyltransferase
MKLFERLYLCCLPLLPPLQGVVRARLKSLLPAGNGRPRILDVGGRKSHYTIGLPCDVVVSDLPRQSEVQKALHLGINDDIKQQTLGRRSNVLSVVYDDMTESHLEDDSFDAVVSVEVLEHVERDDQFIENVFRVLKPGGFFLMTTPNGDHVKHNNPDHKRHYRRDQLRELLGARFEAFDVDYAILGGRNRRWGIKPWSLRRPVQTLLSMIGNFLNRHESSAAGVRHQARGTHHLIALAYKSPVAMPAAEPEAACAVGGRRLLWLWLADHPELVELAGYV